MIDERYALLSMIPVVAVVMINHHNFDAPKPAPVTTVAAIRYTPPKPKPVQYIAVPKYVATREFNCLVRNIYFEAGVEPTVGKFAVATVTLNRLKTGYWGHSICRVVYAKAQFSWTQQKHLPKPSKKLWQECRQVALESLRGARVVAVKGSLFYYADYIKKPFWAEAKYRIAKIGQHIFYRDAKGFNLPEQVAFAD